MRWCDPGLDQLDRQARQPGRRQAGERRAVVAAQHPRQAVLAERVRQHRPDMRRVGPADRLAADQEAAVPVAHRERLDMDAVAGQEPALEVGAPHVVRRPAGRQRRALRRHPPAPRARPRQPGTVERRPDRARRRPFRLRLMVLEPRLDLARPPARETMAHRHHRLDHLRGQIPGFVSGARDRSTRPAEPSARYRASHLWPVFRLIPKCRHSSDTLSSPATHDATKHVRSSMMQVSLQGMAGSSPTYLQDLSPMSPV